MDKPDARDREESRRSQHWGMGRKGVLDGDRVSVWDDETLPEMELEMVHNIMHKLECYELYAREVFYITCIHHTF